MSEPITPSQPQPFASEPTQPAGGGCAKPLLIGCGVLAVLGVLLIALIAWKARDLFAWSLGTIETHVEQIAPADLTPAERQRLAAAFDGAKEAVASGDVDPVALQRLQAELMAVASAQSLDREQIVRLTEVLEAVAGRVPEPEGLDPPPAEPAAPEPQPATA